MKCQNINHLNNASETAIETCIDVQSNSLKLNERNNIYAYQTFFLESDTDYILSFNASYYGSDSDISDSNGLYIFMLGAEDLVNDFANDNFAEIKNFFDDDIFPSNGDPLDIDFSNSVTLINDFSAVLYKNIPLSELNATTTQYNLAFNSGDKQEYLLIIGKNDQMPSRVTGDFGFYIDDVSMGIGELTFDLLHGGLQHELIFSNLVSGMKNGIDVITSDDNMLSNAGVTFTEDGSYVDIVDSGGSITIGGEMTIALWIRLDASGDWRPIFECNDIVNNPYYIDNQWKTGYDRYRRNAISIMIGNQYNYSWAGERCQVVFKIYNDEIDEIQEGSEATIMIGVWTHIVATVNNNSINIYQDGNNVKSRSISFLPTVKRRTNNRIGNSGWNSSFKGAMKSLQIWNRALDDSEVMNLYNESYGKYIYNKQIQHELLFYNSLYDNIGDMDVSAIHSLGDDIIFDGTNDCYVELGM